MTLAQHKKKLWIGGGVILGASVLALSSGYVAKPLVNQIIRHNGFPEASMSIPMVTPKGIYIEHISLDRNEFSTVEGITVNFSWLDALIHHKIDSVSIKNITMTGEIGADGQYKIAGWNANVPKPKNEKDLIPFRSLLIEGARLEVETTQGNIRVEGKLSLDTPTPDQQNVVFSVWGRQRQLSFETSGTADIHSNGLWSLQLKLEDGRTTLPNFEIGRASGWIKVEKTSLEKPVQAQGKIVAGRVNTLGALLQDVDLQIDTQKNELVSFKTSPSGHPHVEIAGQWIQTPAHHLDITLTSQSIPEVLDIIYPDINPDIKSWLEMASPVSLHMAAPFASLSAKDKTADWDLSVGNGPDTAVSLAGKAVYQKDKNILSFTIPEKQIDAAKLGAYFPIKDKAGLKLSTGSVTASGKLSISLSDTSKIQGPIAIRIKDVGGVWENYALSRVNGDISLPSILPYQFSTPRAISLALEGAKGPVGLGELSVSGSPSKGIDVKGARFSVAGGTVIATSFKLPQKGKPSPLTLDLDKIDMEKLVQIAEIKGLSAKGFLHGQIPLILTSSGIEFKGGVIENSGEGVFSYRPEEFPAALRGEDLRLQTIREALTDFHFKLLSFTIDGPFSGNLKSVFKAQGLNPVFGERPLNLNINMEGALGQVLRNMMQSGALSAGDLEDKLRSIKEK